MTHFCAEVFAAVRPLMEHACILVVLAPASPSLTSMDRQNVTLSVQIQKGKMWCNSSFLNALLLDALQPRLQGLEEL